MKRQENILHKIHPRGTILVLMKELGVRFESSISMLVSFAVPEGKGVSFSASVEVASMTAIAAAHGLSLNSRELALPCQQVENHVVGAPCGVMDQMTSACGEANKLLAMICQPAEVLGLVDIPSHIRFWGIDSGIRHRYLVFLMHILVCFLDEGLLNLLGLQPASYT